VVTSLISDKYTKSQYVYGITFIRSLGARKKKA